jgi:pimeloyl-ACP methyl ester carboxylesterase
MPHLRVNDVELFYDEAGDGDPLVLVHGSWGDHSNWQGVVPTLTQSFRVVTYDRRGHSRSGRPIKGRGARTRTTSLRSYQPSTVRRPMLPAIPSVARSRSGLQLAVRSCSAA